jgi:hypothetical protein
MTIKSKDELIEPEPIENLSDIDCEFPCTECLVTAICSLYCFKVFNYMNFIADTMQELTANQICIYRTTTPQVIIRKIEEFYKTNKRLVSPQRTTVSRDWK